MLFSSTVPVKSLTFVITTDEALIPSPVSTTTFAPDLSSPVMMVWVQPSCVHTTVCVAPADCPFTVTWAVTGGSEPGGCGESAADEQPAMPATTLNAVTVTTTNRFCTAQI